MNNFIQYPEFTRNKFMFYKYYLDRQIYYNNLLECSYHLTSRKNTFNDVQNEINLPGINTIVEILEFSPEEREIYESEAIDAHELHLRQLCCHPLLVEQFKFNEANTISDIKTKIIDKYNNLINDNNTQYNNLERVLISLNNTSIEQNTTIISDELVRLRNSLQDIHNYNNLLQKRITYLNNNYSESSNKFACNICFSDTEDDPSFQVIVISCGHNLCKACMRKYMKSTTGDLKCPTCKQIVDLDTCYNLKNSTLNNDDNIEKYGTKVANIIKYIQNVPNNDKIIIFTEWDDMMNITGNILNNIGIKVKYCKGNVYQRNKIIKDFKNGVYKVLFLSSKHCASGSNLTEANHIIFLEPISGDPEYVKTTEKQAIARAERIGQDKVVTVVKYIIKDTIEEKLAGIVR